MKKLIGEELVESSSTVKPEIREEISNEQKEEINIITESIAQSFVNRYELTLILKESFKDREVKGTVVLIDQYLRSIRIELSKDNYEWVKLDDIVKVSFLITSLNEINN